MSKSAASKSGCRRRPRGGEALTAAGGGGNHVPRVSSNPTRREWLVAAARNFAQTIAQRINTASGGGQPPPPPPPPPPDHAGHAPVRRLAAQRRDRRRNALDLWLGARCQFIGRQWRRRGRTRTRSPSGADRYSLVLPRSRRVWMSPATSATVDSAIQVSRSLQTCHRASTRLGCTRAALSPARSTPCGLRRFGSRRLPTLTWRSTSLSPGGPRSNELLDPRLGARRVII